MIRTTAKINGFCDPVFEQVRVEFERNFEERGEVGAAVAVYADGKPVVDLWAGLADQETGQPWQEDTLVTAFSATKGPAALCMHILADRGLLDFNAPVAHYWPEFAANGKESITVAMVLSHQAGVPVWQQELPEGALLDWDIATTGIAKEAPIWEPGSRQGYHALVIGFIEGELVRRITSKTIGQFLRENVAVPLDADVWIGLPESEEGRVATLYLPEEPSLNSGLFQKMAADPEWYGAKMFTNTGNDVTPESVNLRPRRAAEIPAAGGVMNARGLARVYRPLSLDGSVDSVRVVNERMLPCMRTVRSASNCDDMLRIPTTFTLGFSKTWGDRRLGEGEHVIMGEHAFGTAGFGGSLGFADGDAKISFGYVMNKLGGGVGLNNRCQSLVDAAYQAAGYTSSEPGFWVRV